MARLRKLSKVFVYSGDKITGNNANDSCYMCMTVIPNMVKHIKIASLMAPTKPNASRLATVSWVKLCSTCSKPFEKLFENANYIDRARVDGDAA